MSLSTPNIDLLPIGIIRNTHGLKGELKVSLLKPGYSEVFKTILSLYIEDNSYEIERVRTQHKGLIIKLKTINNIDQAKTYKTNLIYGKFEEIKHLFDQNQGFIPEAWIGFEVLDENNENIGKIKDIIYTGANEVISVWKAKEETLIPVIAEYISELNHASKTITVKKPVFQ